MVQDSSNRGIGNTDQPNIPPGVVEVKVKRAPYTANGPTLRPHPNPFAEQVDSLPLPEGKNPVYNPTNKGN